MIKASARLLTRSVIFLVLLGSTLIANADPIVVHLRDELPHDAGMYERVDGHALPGVSSYGLDEVA
jgi:hypothetical protein